MEAILWFVGIGFVVLFLWALASNKRDVEEAKSAISMRAGFKSDLDYVSPTNFVGLAIDNTNNQILFTDSGRQTVVPFKNLIAVEILEDGTSVTKTSTGSLVGGAVVGGVLLGGVGAIIGGLSADTTTSERVSKIVLRVVTDDLHHPNVDIEFLSLFGKGVKRSSADFKAAIKEAAEWHSRMATILKRQSEANAAGKPATIEYSEGSDTSPRRLSTPSSKSAASPVDDEFEAKWNTLVKYDPDIKFALSELAEFGASGINELKKAFMVINDPSKLGHIVETIKADQLGYRNEEEAAREIAVRKPKIDHTELKQAMKDRKTLDDYLKSKGYKIMEFDNKVGLFESYSGKKIMTAENQEFLYQYLLSRFH